MRYESFQLAAARLWREIPEEYKAGVEGVVVERRALAHPKLREIFTLGECLTESWPSGYEGPETLRSVVVLYYGSFLGLSRLERDFDWEGEIWETLTHELKHHLESLASEDALEDLDYAVDENYKRQQGEPFDPYFFRAGERVEAGAYMVEDDLFVQVEQRGGELPEWLEFGLGRVRYRVRAPRGSADVWLIRLTSGVEAPGEVYLVVTRRPGFLEGVRSIFRRTRPRVREEEALAERV